jgi:endonuclease YncB( thermonuclease family)
MGSATGKAVPGRSGGAGRLRAARAAVLGLALAGGGIAAPHGAASAGPPACILAEAAGGRVAAVLSGDTLALEDGRVVRLAGMLAPKPPLDADGPAAAARSGLAERVADRPVRLRLQGPSRDRYGRELAFVFAEGDPVSVQEHLLAAGLVRAEPVPDGACLAGLLAAEAQARAAGRGLWTDASYRVRQAGEPSLGEETDLYEVVEGRIVSVGRGHANVFVDFGRNWDTDFTVTLTQSDAKLFEEALGGLDSLVGRRVRVRGWLMEWHGPAMRLSDPAAIEVLD